MSSITIGSEELAISSARLDDTLIHTNQVCASIHRSVNGDWGFSFESWNSCYKMSINFGQNTNNGTRMNPSRTIGSISSQIISLESGTGIRQNIGVGSNSGDGIPPKNIKSFGLFERGTLDISNRGASWYIKEKSESENPEGNSIFKNSGCENKFEVKNIWRNFL